MNKIGLQFQHSEYYSNLSENEQNYIKEKFEKKYEIIEEIIGFDIIERFSIEFRITAFRAYYIRLLFYVYETDRGVFFTIPLDLIEKYFENLNNIDNFNTIISELKRIINFEKLEKDLDEKEEIKKVKI